MGLEFSETRQDYVLIPNSTSLNSDYITVCGWGRVGYSSGKSMVVAQKAYTSHTPPYYQYNLGFQGTYIVGQLSINGAFSNLDSGVLTFNSGDIFFMAVTYDGTTHKLYHWQNGVQGATAAKSITGTITQYPTDMTIGRYLNTADYTVGTIWDSRVYNRALSQDEIKTIFALQGADKIVDGLVGRWMMMEGSEGTTASVANSIIDISGNGNNGTPYNSPTYTACPIRIGFPKRRN